MNHGNAGDKDCFRKNISLKVKFLENNSNPLVKLPGICKIN